jgi:hypothetical protein
MSLMGAILRDMPPPASTIQRVSSGARQTIATCLAKNPTIDGRARVMCDAN